jgi:putative ABC transport system substrate-binding protein
MGAGAFLMATDNVINSRTDQLVSLAARYRLPAIYQGREAAEAGGLMTYGGDGAEQTRIAGVYVGRILKRAQNPRTCRCSKSPKSSWSST